MLGETVFEQVFGPIKETGGNEPADNDPMRYMQATKESMCLYCDREIREGIPIAGHYGILWGHRLCVQTALLDGELILSPNNKERRPLRLKFLANRVYVGNGRGRGKVKKWKWTMATTMKHLEELKKLVFQQLAVPKEILGQMEAASGRATVIGTRTGRLSAKSPNWSNSPRYSDQRNTSHEEGKQELAQGLSKHGMMEKPKSDCEVFEPIFICRHKIPRDKRPSSVMLDGDGLVLDSPSVEEIVRRMKEEEYQRRYEEWKATQRTLPSCPAHAHLKVVVVPVPEKKPHFDPMWEADIWLVCTHEGKEHRAYRGYELL